MLGSETGIKEAQGAMEASEIRYRRLFEAAKDGILILDWESGHIVDVNPFITEMLGFSHKELLGKKLWEIGIFKDVAANKAAFEELKNKGRIRYEDLPLETRSGRHVNVEFVSNVYEVDHTKVIQCNIRDITERKKAEEERARLSAIIETTPDIVAITDAEGYGIFLNGSGRKLLGVGDGEDISKFNISQFLSKDSQELIANVAIPHAMLMGVWTGEVDVVDRNGKTIPCSVAGILKKDSDGKITSMSIIARDITERKEAEELLRKSEEKYRSLTERMSDILWTMDLNLKTTYVSPSIERLLGFTVEERLKQSVEEQLTPDSRAKSLEMLAFELGRDSEPGVDPNRDIKLELEYYHKNGSIVWLESSINAIRNENGEAMALQGISRDITERKNAEKAIRESEEKYRTLAENSPEMIYLVENDGILRYVNENGARQFKMKASEVIGKKLNQIFSEEMAKKHLYAIQTVIETGKSIKREMLEKFPAREIWIDVRLNPVFDSRGKAVAVLGISNDITERKGLEEKLSNSEKKYRGIFDNAIEGIYQSTPEGKYISANPAFAKMLGYGSPEKLKEEIFDIQNQIYVNPEDRVKIKQMLEKYGKVKNFEANLRRKDGTEIWASINSNTVKGESGEIAYYEGTMADITERRLAQQAIEESEEKYRTLSETSVFPIIMLDLQGNIVYCNQAAAKAAGYERQEELVGRGAISFVAPDDQQRLLDALGNLLKTGTGRKKIEYTLMRRDGSMFPAEMSSSAITDSSGKIINVIAVIDDITERKKAEEDIMETQRRLSDIINFLPDATFAIDINGKVIAWNKAIEEMSGVKAGAILGKGDYEYALPFYKERRPILIDLALGPRKEIESKYSMIKREGKNIVAETYIPGFKPGGVYLWGAATILYDSHGAAVGAIESIRDITERKLSEQILMDALDKRQEMETIVNKSPVVVFKWRAKKGLPIEYVSDSISQFGYSPTDIINRNMGASGLVDPSELAKVESELSKGEKNGVSSFSHECWMKSKSGEKKYVDCKMWVSKSAGGRPTHYHGLVIDLTERKRSEEAQAQIEAVRRLDEMKTRFISIATHELRTPLVSIKGYSDLVLSGRAGEVSERVKDLLMVASRNTDRLIHLTDDLLDVQRIETGRLKMDMNEIDLRDVLSHCISEIRPIIESKRQKFIGAIPEDRMRAMGDPARLEQIIMNILNNASKFTPEEGKIALDARASGKWAEIAISDTGIGIRKQDIGRVFEPFADIKKAHYTKGTGLGLSVAKGLAEAHGGKIAVESPGEGKGATFTVFIPIISCVETKGEKNG